MLSLLRPLAFGLVVFVSLLSAGQAPAQERQPTTEELLDDFRHYVITRQDELAEAAGVAILSRGVTAEEFVGIIEDSRFGVDGFEQAIRQAVFIDALERTASQLEQLYQQGRRDKARNPDEIARNISLLGGNQRGRILATGRLRYAGEYAVPQLLQVLLARTNPALEAEVERLLVSMGADVVAPLTAALQQVDPDLQEQLARILGATQNAGALAPLYELTDATGSDAVRSAAERAITNIAGSYSPELSVSDLYALLAEDYFEGSRSLIRFPGESHQLLWTFKPALGLYPTPIRTEVYHQTRAMTLAEKALALDPTNSRAVTLWIAANFTREIDTPQGYENPVYGSDRRDALYYAVAAGPTVTQEVLARALTDRNTPLARRAISALRRSAGGAGIWDGLSGSRPLLDALSYPDRRVQYEAALALGAANPVEPFPGADQVAPLLASAIRDSAARFALVVSPDFDRQQQLSRLLVNDGYDVLPSSSSLLEAAFAIAQAPGVDLLVVDGSTEGVEQTITDARANPKLQVTPILGLLPVSGWNELRFRYDNDPLTEVRRRGLSEAQLVKTFQQLVVSAAGPALRSDQMRDYAMEALTVLRDLAISGSASLSVSDAAPALIAALESTAGDVRLRVADVLARIGQPIAQTSLMDAALGATGAERVALLDKVARSAKTFGNLLKRRHIKRLLELTSDADTPTATAAAALMGALNLESGEILQLILASR